MSLDGSKDTQQNTKVCHRNLPVPVPVLVPMTYDRGGRMVVGHGDNGATRGAFYATPHRQGVPWSIDILCARDASQHICSPARATTRSRRSSLFIH